MHCEEFSLRLGRITCSYIKSNFPSISSGSCGWTSAANKLVAAKKTQMAKLRSKAMIVTSLVREDEERGEEEKVMA
jgi:hypothetical protein